MRRRTLKMLLGTTGAVALGASAAHAAPFDIVINPTGTFAANSAAVAAFNRAAAQWEPFIADPIQINITAAFDPTLPSGALGRTSSVIILRQYTPVRDAMAFDAADESDDAVVTALPTVANFRAVFPEEFRFDTGGPQLRVSRANYKALGLIASDASSDATISFSPTANFDFDNSDGVTPGARDFETVAAHEIGHALGFQSYVDAMNDGSSGFARPMPLDLFRFEDGSADDPASLAEFTIMSRNLMPGATAITDDLTNEWLMSTGADAGIYPGTDGRQASHWKADELTGVHIGVLDPTVPAGMAYGVSFADLRALDLIGYEITIPEPGAIALLATGGLLLSSRRRTRFSGPRLRSQR